MLSGNGNFYICYVTLIVQEKQNESKRMLLQLKEISYSGWLQTYILNNLPKNEANDDPQIDHHLPDPYNYIVETIF